MDKEKKTRNKSVSWRQFDGHFGEFKPYIRRTQLGRIGGRSAKRSCWRVIISRRQTRKKSRDYLGVDDSLSSVEFFLERQVGHASCRPEFNSGWAGASTPRNEVLCYGVEFVFVLIDSSYLELMQQPTPVASRRRWNALV